MEEGDAEKGERDGGALRIWNKMKKSGELPDMKELPERDGMLLNCIGMCTMRFLVKLAQHGDVELAVRPIDLKEMQLGWTKALAKGMKDRSRMALQSKEVKEVESSLSLNLMTSKLTTTRRWRIFSDFACHLVSQG